MPTLIDVNCNFCNNPFQQPLKLFNNNLRRNCNNYCSIDCSNKAHDKSLQVTCDECGITFKKTRAEIKNTKHNFCSKHCSGVYYNKHKKHGYRRSKLEIYIEKKLIETYGDQFARFNDVTMIGSELDIYIPSLNLAFELNGILHYEPIYGPDKLKYIKNNDDRIVSRTVLSRIRMLSLFL
jgi:endogenous inhibitor of DNA gyrase (YacG/DUF329 family)